MLQDLLRFKIRLFYLSNASKSLQKSPHYKLFVQIEISICGIFKTLYIDRLDLAISSIINLDIVVEHLFKDSNQNKRG